jgi:hypothetical protein
VCVVVVGRSVPYAEDRSPWSECGFSRLVLRRWGQGGFNTLVPLPTTTAFSGDTLRDVTLLRWHLWPGLPFREESSDGPHPH